uniref:HTH_48 domain-containing protein n=1 Tax=Heterorhabditis bacteriophora TaxID=37862 RepID=A0A1I7WZS9_HETBA
MSIALRVSTNHSYEQGEENTAIYRRYLVNRNFAALSIVVRHGVGSSILRDEKMMRKMASDPNISPTSIMRIVKIRFL